MYAHQVIEDLKKLNINCSHFIKGIKQAQCFNLGIESGFGYLEKTGTRLFEQDLRLPYKTIWVDYNFNEHKNRNFHNNTLTLLYNSIITRTRVPDLMSSKRGVLATTIMDGCYIVYIFNFMDEIKIWIPSSAGCLVVAGIKFKDIKKIVPESLLNAPSLECLKNPDEGILDGNMFPFPSYNFGEQRMNKNEIYFSNNVKDSVTKDHLENGDEYKALSILLKLLDSKNISTVNNLPPEKLNKKRIKSGKQPLFTYKTLIIKPTGKMQEAQAAQGLWDNRIHLCRGHFKEYTKERPLFGRITGRFWWQPSVRGNKEKGVVMKDYVVKTGAAQCRTTTP
jgi:hypothetical protein